MRRNAKILFLILVFFINYNGIVAQTTFSFETGSSVTSPAGGWTNTGVGTYYRSTSTSALTLADLSTACNGYTKYNGSGSSIIYFQPAVAISAISVSGTGTGSNRTFSSIATSSTVGGTYTNITGASGSGTIGAGSAATCGTISITSLGTVPANTFIRITFSGNINTTRIDITPANVVTPTTQANTISFNSITPLSFTSTWTRGNGSNVAVFMKEGTGNITNPVDGTDYTASANWSSKGTQLGTSSYYCIYNGTGTSVNLTNLSPSTTYTLQAFEYNGSGTATKYLTTTVTGNPNNQNTNAASPTITVSKTTLNFGYVKQNTNSPEQTFTVSAQFLNPASGSISISAPSNFEISLSSGSGFGSSLGLNYNAGTLASTTIYVRYLPNSVASNSGNISVSGGGDSKTISISGIGSMEGTTTVGDLLYQGNGNWNVTGNWRRWDGETWTTTGAGIPAASNHVWIPAASTVNLEASGKNCNNMFVYGKVTSSSPVNTPSYLKINGSILEVNTGAFVGNESNPYGDNADGLSLDIVGTSLTVTGNGGGIAFSRVRNNAANTTLNIKRDMFITYHGSTNQGGHTAALYPNSGDNFIVNIDAGATVTMAPWAIIATTTSSNALGNLNFTVNVNGSLLFLSSPVPNNTNFPSINTFIYGGTNTGKTFSLNIGSTGVVDVPEIYPNGTVDGGAVGTGQNATITVASGGLLKVSRIADFRKTSQLVTGDGTFELPSGATLRMGSEDGISSSGATGNIQTTTRTFSTGASYSYEGAAAQITGNGLPSTVNNLTINNAAGVSLSTATNVTGALMLSAGNFETNNQLTLKSSAAATARVPSVAGSISGTVTVERFIGIPSAKRAWRMLTVPLRSTTADVSIFDSWQEAGAQITGYGTLVTGTNANTSTNGLDVTSGASIRSFVNGAWADVTNTKTTSLFTTATSAANKSFAVFVRGDRSNLTSTSGTSTTVLRATGTLQTGDQTFDISSTAESYTLVGNPYASPLSFHRFKVDNFNNINPGYWFWNPNNSGNGGAYVAVASDFPLVANSQSYTVTNGTAPDARYIQSGMAFFVQTKTGALANTVVFKEAHKSDSTINNVFRTGAQLEKLQVNIQLLNTTTSSWGNVDGFVARYNNNYSAEIFGLEDISKMLNTEENFSLKRNGNLLAIESRPLVDADDTLFVSMSNIKQNRSYKFAFDPQNFDAPGLSAYLEDAFLNNATPVSLSAPTEIVFTTTTAAGSFAADRFRIVFKASSTLSTTGLTVKASLVEKQVRIDWSMVNENNVKGYTVERSSDGKTFAALTTVNAKANDNSTVIYDATDASPLNGMNYYRIKATDVNGKITYSTIVRIKTNDTKASVTVYPNPVKGEQLNIQLNGLSKGTYTMRLYNNLGQEVYGSTLQVTQAAMSQTLNIAALKTSGVYTLRITNGDQTIEQTIVAQ